MRLVLLGAFFATFSIVYGKSSPVKKSSYNITGKWFLPNHNSSVFYLHFRDSISWIEADAVCQFHHSHLVTVNTAAIYEDVKSYLKELHYDEPVWIGLRRTVAQGPFKWTDDGLLSTNEYWQESPLKEEKLCVTSSPSDNYRWTARKCNGPDVASFICEMPIPKWVQKSACLDSLNPSITITFHPEKSVIKAVNVCQNTDVKYIECHDPQGKEDKFKQNLEMMKEHLICELWPIEKLENLTSSTTLTAVTNTFNVSSATTLPNSRKKILTTMKSTLHSNNITDYNIFANTESYNRKTVVMEINSESSTISYPQEMSFAEEPIKASKPFAVKDPTDFPQKYYSVTEDSQPRFNFYPRIMIPTSHPIKTNSDKAPVLSTDLLKNNANTSSCNLTTSATVFFNTTRTEESHEVFNNEKEREIFHDPALVKKQMKIDFVKNDVNTLKNIFLKSSESEEEQIGDRTYNIEGTFDSSDFVKAEPINLYKKSDLTSLESSTKNTVTSLDRSIELKKNHFSNPEDMKLQTTISSLSANKNQTFAFFSDTSYSNNQTTKENYNVITQTETSSTKKFELSLQKTSPLLSKIQNNENEASLPGRKRHFTKSERHSFYPYFLGRILG